MITGPSAEQGLLIAHDHYDRLGGYQPDARRSEARLLRQLGRRSRTMLRSRIMMVAYRRYAGTPQGPDSKYRKQPHAQKEWDRPQHSREEFSDDHHHYRL